MAAKKKTYNAEGTLTLSLSHQVESALSRHSYAGKGPSSDGMRAGTHSRTEYVQEASEVTYITFCDSRQAPHRSFKSTCSGHVGFEEALSHLATTIRNFEDHDDGSLDAVEISDEEVVLNYFSRKDEAKNLLLSESRKIAKQAFQQTGDNDPFVDRDDMVRSIPCRVGEETANIMDEIAASKGYVSWWDMPDHI